MRSTAFIILFCCIHLSAIAQTVEYRGAQWWMGARFVPKTVYSVNGIFSFIKPAKTDSVADLSGKYCIPPFGDAHTHNLDGMYNLPAVYNQYVKDGVMYVQVVGNHGQGAVEARPVLERWKKMDVRYANALLTATYGHGFYPYEPLAMSIFMPREQMRLADSIKKSRLAENDAYIFLDSVKDVDEKWPLIMRYKPDFLKICLLDAINYPSKRKAEIPDTYGLSTEVAAYVVKKAHANGLRVIAHVETADDARICARIGVDALAHLPGYAWSGKIEDAKKYCLTKADAGLIKKSGMTVIPTLNLDYSNEFDSSGKMTAFPDRFNNTLRYKKTVMGWFYQMGVPIALGADYFGRTVSEEIDFLVKHKIFTDKQLLEIYCTQTPQHIFPRRKIGLIKEGYEASFLALNTNPLENIQVIRTGIALRVKQGQLLSTSR